MNPVNQQFRNKRMAIMQRQTSSQQAVSRNTSETVKPQAAHTTITHKTTIEKAPICSMSAFEKDSPTLEIPYTIYKGYNANKEYKIYAIIRMPIEECHARLKSAILKGIKYVCINRKYQDYSMKGKSPSKFFTVPTAMQNYDITNKNKSITENFIVYGITEAPDDNIIVALEKTYKNNNTKPIYNCRIFKNANFENKKDPIAEEYSVSMEEIDSNVISFF